MYPALASQRGEEQINVPVIQIPKAGFVDVRHVEAFANASTGKTLADQYV